jgi:hypothetical protein
MKDGKPMRRNNRFPGLSGIAMVLFLFLLFPCLYAQDAIPALSRPLEPLRIPGETKEMHRGMRLITVHDSLPASFTHSLDNVIEDENRSLSPFFQKLNDMTGPVRIVHIGDSHVRGHLYPLITRRQGISLDNFSVRGSSGLHLRSIPLHTLCDFQRLRPYDLIVVQYGLNVATERGVKYDGYKKGMLSVIEHLKTAFPETSILLVSVGDREYKNENGDLRTMPGVKNLIRYQQSIAADSHIAFWNMYEAMGGQGSIVDMIGQKMANLDYTHINFKGGKHLAGILFETLMYGKEQYERRKAYEEE